METELALLANAGATALVALMVSDSWGHTRGRFARFFARDGGTDGALQRLEASRTEIVAARTKGDDPRATAIQAEWKTRFHEALRAGPEAAEELRRLIHPPTTTRTVQNIAHGSGHFGTVIQAGEISGASFNLTPAPADHIRETKPPSK
jgi:hypothetical protein